MQLARILSEISQIHYCLRNCDRYLFNFILNYASDSVLFSSEQLLWHFTLWLNMVSSIIIILSAPTILFEEKSRSEFFWQFFLIFFDFYGAKIEVIGILYREFSKYIIMNYFKNIFQWYIQIFKKKLPFIIKKYFLSLNILCICISTQTNQCFVLLMQSTGFMTFNTVVLLVNIIIKEVKYETRSVILSIISWNLTFLYSL